MADNITNESILAPIPDLTKSGSIPVIYIIAAILVILIVLISVYLIFKKKSMPVKKEPQQPVQQQVIQPPTIPLSELKIIIEYIKNTRLSGYSDIQIKEALQKNGWSLEKIDAAFKSV